MTWLQMALGALAGAGAGLLLARSGVKACSKEGCNSRIPVPAAMLAGAVVGAAMVYYIASR